MNQEIQVFTQKIMENLNMVFAMALDDQYEFADAQARFRELVDLLIFYHCDEAAADQLCNFAKIAFFRGQYAAALSLLAEAAEKTPNEEKRGQMAQGLHDMAFQLLERGLQGDAPDAQLLELAEKQLAPGDYAAAMERARANARQPEELAFVRRLAMEVLRQGIRLEQSQPEQALTLLRAAVPSLNAKRSALVEQEIAALERKLHGSA